MGLPRYLEHSLTENTFGLQGAVIVFPLYLAYEHYVKEKEKDGELEPLKKFSIGSSNYMIGCDNEKGSIGVFLCTSNQAPTKC
mmetsp:Transcript_8968/g.22073  ORF Transcript_8968/g.22073 Transcript_8968/m.22073 type:complete len:83 (-) Transcript_8968:225-473(-)